MSQENSSSDKMAKKPIIKAGSEIIDRCPVCQVKFAEPVATNIKHECPNPSCYANFSIHIYEPEPR